MKTPQCHLLQNLAPSSSKLSLTDAAAATISSSLAAPNSITVAPAESNLLALPDDVLFQILLHCGPREVDETIKLVSRHLHKATSMSLDLWKTFCSTTGKSLYKEYAPQSTKLLNRFFTPKDFCGLDIAGERNFYRQYYYRNPCVPIDFDTINEALKHCTRSGANPFPIQDQERFYSDEGTVVLMPGAYRERITIHGQPLVEGRPFKSLTIRAAFPSVGASLVHYERSRSHVKNQSAITITTRNNNASELEDTGISVKLSYLQILHATPGADIWNGNTAIMVDGFGAQVTIDSCKIQSDSGRGLVVTNKAELQMTRSSIVDCAATGFYVGDRGSRARIASSNIVRCGFGDIALQDPDTEEEREERDAFLAQLAVHAATGQRIPRDQIEVVPAGHSGVYIESAMAWIEDTLIAGNSLTGVSVVRSGLVNLSGSDVTGNGCGYEEQIMVEDLHDVRENVQLNGMLSIRGGLMEGSQANNFVSRKSNNGIRVYKGGLPRAVSHSITEPLKLANMI